MTNYEIIGDQPMTCPKCGARTEWEDATNDFLLVQFHTCLGCGNKFAACEDDDD